MAPSINELLDFFIPRLCAGCGDKLLPSEKIICNKCYANLDRVGDELLTAEFNRKFEREGIIDGFFAPFIFEKGEALQNLIHELKYSKRFLYGQYLGEIIAKIGKSVFNEWKPDLIIPVPLHKMKKVERGYNQSDFIAKGIKSLLKIPVKTGLLKRNRFTESQTQFSMAERKINIDGAFTMKKNADLSGNRVLLVDDVITTGATTTEAAKQLKRANAEKVFAVSSALAE